MVLWFAAQEQTEVVDTVIVTRVLEEHWVGARVEIVQVAQM